MLPCMSFTFTLQIGGGGGAGVRIEGKNLLGRVNKFLFFSGSCVGGFQFSKGEGSENF